MAAARRPSAFGDGTVFLERYVTDPRHVEVQILGDAHGNVVHLFERECSIQRRYQKIVEECPSPAVDADLRDALTAAAVAAGQAIGYTGAGTVEFVLDRDGKFYFLEMNTRLQVEHPVTEEVTGLDLVELQLRIAEGEPLPPAAREAQISGHAIEVRLYAEDVPAGFAPATGMLHRFRFPAAPGIRVDTGFRDGSVVSPHYDAMLAKVDRARPDPGRRGAAAGPRARPSRDPRRDHQPRPARGHPARAGVPGRRHRHRLPHQARTRGPGRGPGRGPPAMRWPRRSPGRRGTAPRRLSSHVPSGWRNVFSAPQRVTYTAAGQPHEVTYRIRGNRVAPRSTACPLQALVRAATPDQVDLEIDGTRRVYRVHQVGTDIYVDASDGSSALSEIPRFGDPAKLAPAGSLLAPMPGLVLRVLAEPGAVVTAGQPLLVLEAMKMEQTVSAPADGVVAELRAKAGEQVSTGQVLAVLEAGD